MVARADGAAQLSLYVVVFVCLFIISFGLEADRIYFDRAQLLLIGNNHAGVYFDFHFLYPAGDPMHPSDHWRKHRPCETMPVAEGDETEEGEASRLSCSTKG